MKKMFLLSVLCFCVSLYSVNPVYSQNTGESSSVQINNIPYECEEDLIEIMFDKDSQVRLRNGSLVDFKSDALTGVDQILEQLDWHTWYRICDVPEDILDQWSVNGERNTGKPVYNMNNIYRLQIPKGFNIWEITATLEELPGVLLARPVPKPMELPVPPNYQSQQGYLNPASSTPTGIDATYAWTQTGGIGTGVTVCDLEYSWNYSHADIIKAAGSQINTLVQDPFSDNNHGTAVIGELVADNNSWGTTGICYGANLKTCGTYYGSPVAWNVPGAMAVAIASLSAGDIILLEQQWEYTSGSGNYIPIEWWLNYSPSNQTNNGVYAAIVNAVSNGINVVEAGGNGNVNTDGLTWFGNSGAIIVGAGGASISNDLQRLSFSSYGTRFDLQGWGENVFTTGYGTYYSAEGVNYYYTSTFNGTSSASPIVAGALACAEGYYLANVSITPPTPAYMRTHLSNYGTAQVFGPSGNIGPRPNLYAAINNFPPPAQNYDWGDAMDPPYPTWAASTGANHLITSLFLGNSVDPEQNGQPTPNADGDDLDGNNDDDGVIFNSVLRPGATVSVTITASAPGGLLNAWIDFNGINAWADPGEQIFTNVSLGAGTNNLNFTVPASSLMGTTTSRFRLSTQPGIPFFGQAPDGEVEDYLVFIDEPIPDEFDWGDAPDPNYPTLSMNNGANHFLDGITYLGNQVDGEPDGQPEPMAMGDDNDIIYPPANDDEDGVTFLTPFIQNQTANIDVVASVPGILNAWLDFAQDGSWAEAGDHIFIDAPLVAGNNPLNIWIPSTATPGQTFIRFRFDINGGLNFDGPATEGEVEDYEIYIEEGQVDEFDFGDAPEGNGATAYPSLGVDGMFPTCITVGPIGSYIQHGFGENWAWFGPMVDIETDGNAGSCPGCFPPYDVDECFQDGDAGLIMPEPFTIDATNTVVPCTGFLGTPLGTICQNATWGVDIDIDVTNNMPVDGYINVLFDWNQDGQWQNDLSTQCAGITVHEYVVPDLGIPAGYSGTLSGLLPLGSTFQIGPNAGYVWVRFSITDVMIGLNDWDGSGVFEDGETEDYLLLILEQEDEIDFGDAPDPNYPTFSASNGAHHWIDGITFMGNMVDGEPDGQPDAQAQGDDQDIFYPPPNDDEDGVVFTSAIIQGQNATVDVVASVLGVLNAWFDFNANGSWADPGEHVFVDVNLNPGLNSLTYNVPAAAVQGNSFARFRFSTIGGLNFDGPAPDGEVEDYQIYIGIPTSDIQIDPDPTGSFVQNEISMALVPGGTVGVPAVLLAAYNDDPYPGGPGLGVSYSTDGGATWTPLQLPYPANPLGITYLDMFDPTATADGNGDLYVAHISTDYDWTNGPESGLYVHKSTNGGVTWAAPVTIAYDGKPTGSPDPNYRFNDRCQMIADIDPASPYYNNLYTVWIKDRGWQMSSPLSDIYFSSSTDGGATWSTNITINQTIHNMGNMPNPTVASDGTIYVCWMDYNVWTGGTGTIYMNVSPDGGITWLGTDMLVRTVNLPPLRLNGGTDVLAKGAAVIEVSPFNPQEIYIVYAEASAASGDEGDIFFIRSTDGGATWSNPLRVNDDTTLNDQVMPWMDVKPNGTIDIAWYDRRNDLLDLNWDVYFTASLDGGNTFIPNQQVNAVAAPSPNTPSGFWMGEYLGLVVDNTHAYIGFTSSVLDINGDVFFNSVQNPVVDIDYGDAADPSYPTWLASNGARHTIDGVTFLGASVDPEPDGQPDPNALGDDNDGNDDEDGVTFDWPLAVGNPCKITVNASVGNGLFSGWIDFDGNGSWADPGEQIFIDIPLVAGDNSLSFMIPTTTTAGLITYARFRFSTQPGLSYDGPASDGEVEDFEVDIIEIEDYKWAQYPDTTLPGLHAHDYINAGGGHESIVLADDWLCNGGVVTDIHWWGNYELDVASQEKRGAGIDHFHLSIHVQSAAGCLPHDPEVWFADIPFASIAETYTGMTNNENSRIYLYEYILNIPFDQETGLKYWLDITAFSTDPGQPAIWRWQESMRSYYPIYCGAADKIDPGILPWSTIQWLPNPPHKYSDMAFIITSEEFEPMDFGDADDPTYPTYLANDGARHLIDGATFMGASVDQESNGQPDPNALGDDNDGNDDEDGVTFTTSLVQGQTASADIVVSVDGILNVWLDFNANGSWGDPGEQIATDVSVSAGTYTLTFNVPLTATVGTTYSRFRFSTDLNLSYTGQASNGEVEDHEVTIEEVPNKWAQYPDTLLPGLHAHDYDSPPYGQIILADDWICEGGWVTDFHWWGNYELDALSQEIRGAGIDHFHLSIHTLDPTGCLPQDPEIWGVDIPFSSLTEHNTGLVNLEGCSIYLYDYILEEPFPQIQGEHYWLDITAFCTDPVNPAHWRWQESSRKLTPVLCGAVDKTLPNPGTWQTISWANLTFSDMAFVITSGPAPELDMGDADDPTYPTLMINSGAAHIIDGITFLGTSVDSETDGQPDPNALGDDNDGNDDEDGVTIVSPFFPGSTFSMINVIASVNGLLNVWIDYNANGSWADPGEHTHIDHPLTGGAIPNTLFFVVPPNALVGKTYARFRFSTDTGLTYTGIASNGEVEDHEITIEGDLDFGDAADPTYPTLLASDGARHVIDPTIYLGNSPIPIDAEPDGHQSTHADGDDILDGNDDEDGVLIPAILSHGSMNSITVIASANGYLNGWIDFDGSGNWTEADEHVLMNQSITAGTNTLNIAIPSTSVKGTTYARFRFSTVPGLSYVGQAPDGEVEDYEVEIGEPEKWIQNPDLSDFGLDVDATFDNILADDFLCTTTGPITRIEIWGSWLYDYIPSFEDPGAVIFTLSIHEDIPADQSPTGYSMPGDVIWWNTYQPLEFMFEPFAFGLQEGWYNPATGYYEPLGDTQCWKYIFELDEGEFVQEGTADEPKVYWLDVQAQPLDPDPFCRFGWKTSVDHWNDDAVWTIGTEPYLGDWNELRYPDGHPLFPESIDLAFAIYGLENPYILVDLTAFLEGPFSGSDMQPTLNGANLIPLNQPYSSDPTAKWHYTGTESVGSIPGVDIVDWVMIELRDATSASNATGLTMIDEKAAFIKRDGKIVATDGTSLMKFYVSFSNNPYAVVWHRNHLGILSANPLNNVGLGLYRYDFTTGLGQAYLNGQKHLGGGIYGMMGGDGQPDGNIDSNDQINVWAPAAGTTGYLMGDYNMDTQVDNKDKNDVWYPNNGSGTQVPN